MKSSRSPYQQIIDRLLRKKLGELEFKEVKLDACISYEALFRRNDVWFGTSWDWRDQYLDLDFGHLYWMKDVMPRVFIAGNYSSFCSQVKRLEKKMGEKYLEDVANTVAASLEAALEKYTRDPSLGDTKLLRLRAHILGRVADADLFAYEA